MSDMKYCPSCGRNVNTEHSWHTVVLIVLLILGLIPGLIYLAWKWPRRCPICHTPEGMMTAPIIAPMPGVASANPQYVPPQSAPAQSVPQVFCSKCGMVNMAGAAVCKNCGTPLGSPNQPVQQGNKYP